MGWLPYCFQICFIGLGATTNRVARGNQTLWPFLSTSMTLDYQGVIYQQKHIRWNQLPGYGSSFQLGMVVLQETHIAINKKMHLQWGLFSIARLVYHSANNILLAFVGLGALDSLMSLVNLGLSALDFWHGVLLGKVSKEWKTPNWGSMIETETSWRPNAWGTHDAWEIKRGKIYNHY